MTLKQLLSAGTALVAVGLGAALPANSQTPPKRPNVVVLMSDDTGWADLGAYLGGAALGHPTPNLDRIAKEGALFTNWYGQASCTAGRASFITGRIPIRSALSVVVVPGDPNGLRKETPTIAEFYQKNGYSTYFSGKWHLGDVDKFYPIEHGFDEMKQFAAYYPGVYGYSDTAPNAHPWFPKGNAEFWKMYTSVVNLYEWEGTAGKPAVKGDNGRVITLENLADFDMRQTDSAIDYIKKHATGQQAVLHGRQLHEDAPARPARTRCSRASRTSATTRIRCWSSTTTSAGSWTSSAPKRPTRSSSSAPTMAPGRMPGRTPGLIRSAAKRVHRSRPAGAFRASCGAPGRIPAGAGPARDDVAHGRVADDCHDGRPQGAAQGRDDGQQRQADLLRRHRQLGLRDAARPSIRPATGGSISTARTSQAFAPTSLSTRMRPT